MMALVHGKVRECAARLALAEQMMKVCSIYQVYMYMLDESLF